MKYQWSSGFHPPKGVTASQAMAAVDALPEPTPSALLDASKSKRHVLHSHLWAEGDQVWAQRARLTECRRIIGHIEEVVVIGGKTITTRSVEFVRGDRENGQWATLEQIIGSPDMMLAYLADAKRLQMQAVEKVAKIEQLIAKTKGD